LSKTEERQKTTAAPISKRFDTGILYWILKWTAWTLYVVSGGEGYGATPIIVKTYFNDFFAIKNYINQVVAKTIRENT